MTDAKAGYGTILQWNTKPIAEVTSITGPSLTIDQIDCTHYTSPQQFKEFIAGFGDGGEITFDCNFIPGDTDGQIAFITDAYAKQVRDVEVDIGNPILGVWTFEGVVTKLDFTQPMDGKAGFSATIKVSGVPNLAINESLGLTALVITANSGPTTLVPVFDNAKYLYNTDVLTTETWIKITATQLTNPHTIRARINSGSWTALTSGSISGELAIGAADTVTLVEVNCYETGKIAKTYKVYVARPTP